MKSGIPGVLRTKSKKWRVQINHNREIIYLGTYKDLRIAACYRLAAERVLGHTGKNSNLAWEYLKRHGMTKLIDYIAKKISYIDGPPTK